MAVSEYLCETKAFPRENQSFFTGPTKYSVPEFKGYSKLAFNSERLVQIESDSNQVDNWKTLEKVKTVAFMANKEYNSLNISSKWNNPGGHCHDHVFGT